MFFILILKILSVVILLLISIAYLTIAERKIMGAFQQRKGLNIRGFVGILQPFADGLKLFIKCRMGDEKKSHLKILLFVLLTAVVIMLPDSKLTFFEYFLENRIFIRRLLLLYFFLNFITNYTNKASFSVTDKLGNAKKSKIPGPIIIFRFFLTVLPYLLGLTAFESFFMFSNAALESLGESPSEGPADNGPKPEENPTKHKGKKPKTWWDVAGAVLGFVITIIAFYLRHVRQNHEQDPDDQEEGLNPFWRLQDQSRSPYFRPTDPKDLDDLEDLDDLDDLDGLDDLGSTYFRPIIDPKDLDGPNDLDDFDDDLGSTYFRPIIDPKDLEDLSD